MPDTEPSTEFMQASEVDMILVLMEIMIEPKRQS